MIAQLPAKITTEKSVYQYLWNATIQAFARETVATIPTLSSPLH
jgi:hypothetical protein